MSHYFNKYNIHLNTFLMLSYNFNVHILSIIYIYIQVLACQSLLLLFPALIQFKCVQLSFISYLPLASSIWFFTLQIRLAVTFATQSLSSSYLPLLLYSSLSPSCFLPSFLPLFFSSFSGHEYYLIFISVLFYVKTIFALNYAPALILFHI